MVPLLFDDLYCDLNELDRVDIHKVMPGPGDCRVCFPIADAAIRRDQQTHPGTGSHPGLSQPRRPRQDLPDAGRPHKASRCFGKVALPVRADILPGNQLTGHPRMDHRETRHDGRIAGQPRRHDPQPCPMLHSTGPTAFRIHFLSPPVRRSLNYQLIDENCTSYFSVSLDLTCELL